MSSSGKVTGFVRSWSLAGSIILLLVIVAAVIGRAIQLCRGHFGYPIDDTYIHMAMAKHFALHGVWGVTRYAFSSSTSSPLYTLILSAVYLITGIHDVTPLVLNLVFAVPLLAVAHYILKRAGLSSGRTLFVLTCMVIFIPLPALVESGMEHVLHMLLVLVFVHLSCLTLSRNASHESEQGKHIVLSLVLLSPVLVMTRYEGLFLIFTVSVLLMIQRRWAPSLLLLIAAGIPLALYAIVSMRHGWLPLPNSILLKANVPHGPNDNPVLHFLFNWATASVRAPHIASLVLLAVALLYLCLRRNRTIWTYPTLGLVLFLAMGIMHLQFARTGWYYRYEAYLIATAFVTGAIAIHSLGRVVHQWTLRLSYAFALLAFVTLSIKSYRSMIYGPLAFHNIYEQQFQMARFVNEYYPTETIILDDIGAVCYYTDAHVLDVFGLGNMEPARAKMSHHYGSEWVRDWGFESGAVIAILYSTGWSGSLSDPMPQGWNRAVTWTLFDNFVMASEKVDILAVRPDALPSLKSNVRKFRDQLPPEIQSETLP